MRSIRVRALTIVAAVVLVGTTLATVTEAELTADGVVMYLIKKGTAGTLIGTPPAGAGEAWDKTETVTCRSGLTFSRLPVGGVLTITAQPKAKIYINIPADAVPVSTSGQTAQTPNKYWVQVTMTIGSQAGKDVLKDFDTTGDKVVEVEWPATGAESFTLPATANAEQQISVAIAPNWLNRGANALCMKVFVNSTAQPSQIILPGAFEAPFPSDFGAAPPAAPACSDSEDNDGDNLTDFPNDTGCDNAEDGNETAQCADGLDNDTDGATDFPGDPGCGDADDNNETDEPENETGDGSTDQGSGDDGDGGEPDLNVTGNDTANTTGDEKADDKGLLPGFGAPAFAVAALAALAVVRAVRRRRA